MLTKQHLKAATWLQPLTFVKHYRVRCQSQIWYRFWQSGNLFCVAVTSHQMVGELVSHLHVWFTEATKEEDRLLTYNYSSSACHLWIHTTDPSSHLVCHASSWFWSVMDSGNWGLTSQWCSMHSAGSQSNRHLGSGMFQGNFAQAQKRVCEFTDDHLKHNSYR